MNIKKITAAESDLVVELFDKYRMFYKQPSNIKLAKNFIQARLDNNESVIFVALAEESGQQVPAGFTQLYPTYSSVRTVKNWILNDLYVEPGYRKQKIGETLIRTVMAFAKEQGAAIVELSTAVDNFTAQSLYENIGFKKQDADTNFFTYTITVV